MNTSSNGLDHLKQFEGFRTQAYQDVAGHWTIGYGHLIKANEQQLRRVTLTEAEATQLLAQDVRTAERAVNGRVMRTLEQHEFDALVSLVFNIGEGLFASSTVLTRINTRDTEPLISEAWKRFNKATINGQLSVVNGLTRRRASELELFFSGPVKRKSIG